MILQNHLGSSKTFNSDRFEKSHYYVIVLTEALSFLHFSYSRRNTTGTILLLRRCSTVSAIAVSI